MWPTFSGQGAVRPWTPPETDSDHGSQEAPADPRAPSAPRTPTFAASGRTDFSDSSDEDVAIPRYPYTPESLHTSKSQLLRAFSPPPRKPWSPVQKALSSCMAHLEKLIQTREPTEDQLEYLVAKFEDMTDYLSAPESQSRESDDHLFSDTEAPPHPTGLGISSQKPARQEPSAAEMALSQGYVLEVNKYIESVKKQIKNLKMRSEEVKQLNDIQLDIIAGLRQELKRKAALEDDVQQLASIQFDIIAGLREELKLKTMLVAEAMKMPASSGTRKIMKGKLPPQGIGFWAAIGEALDEVGKMLFEY